MIIFKEKTIEVLVEPGYNIEVDEIDQTVTYLSSMVRLACKNDIYWPFMEVAVRPRGKATGSLRMTKRELSKLKELVKFAGSKIQIRSFKEE